VVDFTAEGLTLSLLELSLSVCILTNHDMTSWSIIVGKTTILGKDTILILLGKDTILILVKQGEKKLKAGFRPAAINHLNLPLMCWKIPALLIGERNRYYSSKTVN
jgi:hypothetical protein